ncbi:MAG: hypothetical protein K1X79_01150 [Oligoflexia bacterium]|nr:hypothetical protein [Oligoflexia bacterium]
MNMKLTAVALSLLISSVAAAETNELSSSEVAAQLKSMQAAILELKTVISKQSQRISVLELENGELKAIHKNIQNEQASQARGVFPLVNSAGRNLLVPGKSHDLSSPSCVSGDLACSQGGPPAYVGSPSGQGQRASLMGSSLTPDIGLVADFVGTSTQSTEDVEGNDRLSAREVELVLGHDVDPYARLDAVISLSDAEEVSLEEAYVTTMGLPAGFKARLGKFRPKIGRVNPRHRDSLSTVDEPRLIQSYFGPEGMSKTGIEFSNFLPLPWESVTHEVTLGVMDGGVGEEGSLLAATGRNPSFYGRLRNAWEISDISDLELAGTLLKGSSDADSAWEVTALGVDTAYSHHFGPISRLRFEAEALFQDRRPLETISEDTGQSLHPWGAYALVDYRFLDRWSMGMRGDYLVPVVVRADAMRNGENAWSAYLTFFQTEFSRWRFQYERVNFAEAGHDNLFFLQATFAIGNHKHALD